MTAPDETYTAPEGHAAADALANHEYIDLDGLPEAEPNAQRFERVPDSVEVLRYAGPESLPSLVAWLRSLGYDELAISTPDDGVNLHVLVARSSPTGGLGGRTFRVAAGDYIQAATAGDSRNFTARPAAPTLFGYREVLP